MEDGEAHLEGLVLRLWDRRFHVECELVASVLSDPRKGVREARAAGISCALLECEDLRLIYAACEVASQYGRDGVLQLARRALKAEGHWDDQARAFERGQRGWSDVSLQSLAGSYPSPAMVRHYAEQLVDLDGRLTMARACWRQMVAVLRGDELPGCTMLDHWPGM